MKWLLMLMGVVCCVMAASAQVKQMTDLERVGTADLIVLASIQKVVDAGKETGTMTMRVQRTIKGTAGDTVDVHNLVWLRGPAVKAFAEGKEFLFFLQAGRDGYVLPRAMASLRPAGDADRIAEVLKNFPIAITIADPVGKITIGQRMPVMLTVKNMSDKPIGISAIDLQGFYMAPYMDATLSKTIGPETNGNHVAIWEVTMIDPGKEYIARLEFAGELPTAWRVKPPAAGTEEKVNIRFRVTVDIETPKKRDTDTYYVCTPLLPTRVVMAEQKSIEEVPEEAVE